MYTKCLKKEMSRPCLTLHKLAHTSKIFDINLTWQLLKFPKEEVSSPKNAHGVQQKPQKRNFWNRKRLSSLNNC